MADHETDHHSDGTDQETDSASENNGDVDAETERQDQIITELQKSLEAEQRVSKGLRENIRPCFQAGVPWRAVGERWA